MNCYGEFSIYVWIDVHMCKSNGFYFLSDLATYPSRILPTVELAVPNLDVFHILRNLKKNIS